MAGLLRDLCDLCVRTILCVGCGSPPAVEEALPAGGVLDDVELIVGSGEDQVRLTLVSATVGEDGSGAGVAARAEIPPNLVVTGTRSSWDLARHVVVFEGDVRAVRGPVVLTCDRLEVVYESERVREASAAGHIRVIRDGREATSDRAHLTVADGRIALEGGPELRDGANRMTGERIVLFLDDDRLECENCRLEVDGAAVTR